MKRKRRQSYPLSLLKFRKRTSTLHIGPFPLAHRYWFAKVLGDEADIFIDIMPKVYYSLDRPALRLLLKSQILRIENEI